MTAIDGEKIPSSKDESYKNCSNTVQNFVASKKKRNIDSDSDSDDTAELFKNLTKKSLTIDNTTNSSPPLVQFSPNKPSRNNNDNEIPLTVSNNGLCADNVGTADDTDDESSVDTIELTTRRFPIKCSFQRPEVNKSPCSKDNAQHQPKESLLQCLQKDHNASPEVYDSNEQRTHHNSPIQFRLPTQSSSSEGSDSEDDTDEDRADDMELKEGTRESNTEYASQSNDQADSPNLSRGKSPNHLQLSSGINLHVKTSTAYNSQQMANDRDSVDGSTKDGDHLHAYDSTIGEQKSNTQKQHRPYQQHQEESKQRKSNVELFHESFLDREITDHGNVNHQSRVDNLSESYYKYNKCRENEQQLQIDQWNRTEQEQTDEAFVDQHANPSTTNDKSFGEIFLSGRQFSTGQDVTNTEKKQQNPQPQQLIDLVNSDSEEENQYNHQHNHHHHTSTQILYDNNDTSNEQWGRQSPARSPKFNIAARSFIHNKPRATFTDHPNITRKDDNHGNHDDDLYFGENDRANIIPTPRRITQDHSNQLMESFQGRRFASNPSHHQKFQREQQLNPTQHQNHASAIGSIRRPWPPSVARTTRRVRDAVKSNIALASSVVVTNKNRNHPSQLPIPSSTSVSQPSSSLQHHNNGDIRNFISRRSILVDETRLRSIESVRSNRHDIQNHSNVTMIKPPPSASRKSQQEEEDDDVIEVYEDEPPPPPPIRRKRATSVQAKPKGKTKRKRAASQKTKPKKGGSKRAATKQSRPRSSGSGRGRGRGGSRFGRRSSGCTSGRGGGSSHSNFGAWGQSGEGWAAAPPVHREDPAFQNVGAEISF
mmetsp:Transcript_18237/g.20636  ORF Transcript_18237/g.20636 Transcript_18237/m.20636 type:complete len:822 (+) Transcript_18237:216-2681(+)